MERVQDSGLALIYLECGPSLSTQSVVRSASIICAATKRN